MQAIQKKADEKYAISLVAIIKQDINAELYN